MTQATHPSFAKRLWRLCLLGVLDILIVCLAIALFFGGFAAMEALTVDDWVEAPWGSRHVTATGVPGETILVRLIDWRPLEGKKSDELQVRLEEPESGFVIQTPVRARLSTYLSDNKEALFAMITVPEVPGQPRAILAGSIFGPAISESGKTYHVEVPLTLEVGPAGEVTTTGSRQGPMSESIVGLILFPLFLLLLGACVIGCPLAHTAVYKPTAPGTA